MKLIDILADKIIELPILEMAYIRRDALHQVQSLSTTLIFHVAKVLLMSNSQYVNHWLTEINGYLIKLDDIYLKPKTSRLTYRQYWQCLMEDPEHNMGKIVKRAREQYPSEKIILPNNLRQQINSIVHNMCVDLANDQVKNAREYLK